MTCSLITRLIWLISWLPACGAAEILDATVVLHFN